MNTSPFQQWLTDPKRRCLVMGVLNITPDSFSDGGRFTDAGAAASAAQQMAVDGADMIDIGGESTRPGSDPVGADEQLRRVIPVIELIRRKLDIVLSIDTTLSDVARAALDAGANVINDISAGSDPRMFELAAHHNAAIVLMHMQGTPKTMQQSPRYDDVVGEVVDFLRQRVQRAEQSGVPRQNILIDPGIGFGKSIEHNLELLRRLDDLSRIIDRPMVVGTSRKNFIGKITGQPDPSQRLFGTAATVAWCVANQTSIVRVHDVKEMSQVVRMIEAIHRPTVDFRDA